jgi:hypothetical protein
MQVNTMDPKRIMISGNNLRSVSPNVPIKSGQVLRGQVLKVDGQEILLKISDNTFNALSQTYVKQGQRLRLLVDVAAKDLIKLRIIGEDSKPLTPEQGLLKAMGLKPSQFLQDVIRELVRFRLPLTADNVQNLSRLLKGELLPLSVWLKGLNVEADAENLSRLYQFFKGELGKEEEAAFFRFINNFENQVLGGFNIYAWPLGEAHYLYLLTQKNKGRAVSHEECFLVLKISSKALGDLWFEMAYKDQSLKVDVVCLGDDAQAIIQQHAEELLAQLETAGYKNTELTTRIGKIDTVLDFVPGPLAEDISYVNHQV